MDIESVFKTEDFKTKFWNWFDGISPEERMKFKYYPSDMAELFFYNKVYKNFPVVNY